VITTELIPTTKGRSPHKRLWFLAGALVSTAIIAFSGWLHFHPKVYVLVDGCDCERSRHYTQLMDMDTPANITAYNLKIVSPGRVIQGHTHAYWDAQMANIRRVPRHTLKAYDLRTELPK